MIPRSEIILFSDSSHSSCVPHFPAQSQTSQHQNILSIVIHLRASGKCFSYKRSFLCDLVTEMHVTSRYNDTTINKNIFKRRKNMIKKFYQSYGYLILLAYLIAAYFVPALGIVAIICMLAPLFFAAIGKGRYWCGNFCPRGNFYDNVLSFTSRKRKVPRFFRSTFLRIFMVLFILSNFTLGIIKNWGNPAGIGFVFYRIIVITTLVAIVLALFYQPRTWCHFCPMGTLSHYIARLRGRKVNIQVGNSCVGCKACNRACPMDLTPAASKGGNVTSMDCILCEKCVYTCPKQVVTKDSSH